MKISFVHTAINKLNPSDYGFNNMITWHDMQFGISYISSYLKKNFHTTNLIFVNEHPWRKFVSEKLQKDRPDIICFGGVSTQFKHVFDIASFIRKEYPTIYQVYGGVHVTAVNLDLMALPFDVLCKGEGEFPILELTQKLEKNESPKHIMNLEVKEGGEIFTNPLRPFLENLDEIPFPDRKMWESYINPQNARAKVLLLSRGCPFDCTYCSNKFLRHIAGGKYVRFRSVENIISELVFLKEEYPETKEVFLESETITTNPVWLKNLCFKLSEFNRSLKEPFVFSGNMRIAKNINYDEIFEQLKKANFEHVTIGIESGSQRLRKEVLHRDYSNEEIYNVFAKAREYGIETEAYNMIGLPDETPQDFLETVKVNRMCQPKDPHLSIFFPYPGTDLLKLSEEKGYLRKDLSRLKEREEAALDMPLFPRQLIEKYYARFFLDIYHGRRNIFRLYLDYFYRRHISQNKIWLKVYFFARRGAVFLKKIFY